MEQANKFSHSLDFEIGTDISALKLIAKSF